MFGRRLGVLALCFVALGLSSCSSSTAPDTTETFTLTGSWGGTIVGGPARTYSVTFRDSTLDLAGTSYIGEYSVTGEQDGIGFAQARVARTDGSVQISFDTTPFQGTFANADTVVGRMTLRSHDYPLTLVRPR